MKDALKRSLAFLLACGMAFSMSFTALAEDDATPTVDEIVGGTSDSEAVVTEVGEGEIPTVSEEALAVEAAPVEESEEPEQAEETVAEEPAGEPAEEPTEDAEVEEVTVEELPAEETEAEAEVVALVDATLPASESPAFTSGYAMVYGTADVFDGAESGAVIAQVSGVVAVTGRVNAGRDGDMLKIAAQVEGETVEGYIAAAAARPLSDTEVAAYLAAQTPETEAPAEETPAEEEVVPAEEGDVPTETVDLAGDAVLADGVTTTMTIPAGTGASANAYAVFTMSQSGLLTITFKSVTIAHGNLEVLVRSANHNDQQLWGISWTQDLGTVNFSDFVDAGTYEIIVKKADATDEASYDISATPMVSRAGEVGVRNNTINNAATLPVDNVDHPGIWSLQDVTFTQKDYYKITLASAGKLELSFSNLTMNDLKVGFYGDDSIEENIAYFDYTAPAALDKNEASATTIRRSNWFDAGVYYLVVSSEEGDTAARGRYMMKLNLEPISLTEKEPNNTLNEASTSNNVLDTVNGTKVTSLLAASSLPKPDGLGQPDMHMFRLPLEQIVDFGADIQFESVKLGVYSRDGVLMTYQDELDGLDPHNTLNAEFGETGTPGSDGNPHMMEMRHVRLPAGIYYLRVDSEGNTGKYSVWAQSKITASVLDVKHENGAIIANGIASGGAKTATKHIYQVWFDNKETGKVEKVYEVEYGTSNGTCVYYPPKSGTYWVCYHTTDGTDWDNKWSDPVVVDSDDFKILTIDAVADAKGKLKITVTYSGNAPLEDSSILIQMGEATVVMEERLFGKTTYEYQCPVSGVYSIMFAGYMPGKAQPWQNAWTDVTVKVPETQLPLKILTLGAIAMGTNRISCNAVVTGGTGLTHTKFTLYESDGTTVVATHESVNGTAYTFTVANPGTYKIGFECQDAHTSATTNLVEVKVENSTMNPLEIVSIKDTSDLSGNLALSMIVKANRALTKSYFELYYNKGGNGPDGKPRQPQLISTLNAPQMVANTVVYHSGSYSVHAHIENADGAADKWYAFTVNLDEDHEGISILLDPLTSDPKSGILGVHANITGCRTPTAVNYYLYRMSSDDPNVKANGLDEVVNYIETVKEDTVKFYVTVPGKYLVVAEASDGKWTDSDYKEITVTTSETMGSEFKVLNATATALNEKTTRFDGVTNDARTLTIAYFIVRTLDGTEVARYDATNRTATVSNLPAGNYSMQFTATDGKTWSAIDPWIAFTVGDSKLNVKNGTATKTTGADGEEYLDVSAEVEWNFPVLAAQMDIHDSVGHIIATWKWNGTGAYDKHRFRVEGLTDMVSVNYSVFDGVKWANKWITIP